MKKGNCKLKTGTADAQMTTTVQCRWSNVLLSIHWNNMVKIGLFHRDLLNDSFLLFLSEHAHCQKISCFVNGSVLNKNAVLLVSTGSCIDPCCFIWTDTKLAWTFVHILSFELIWGWCDDHNKTNQHCWLLHPVLISGTLQTCFSPEGTFCALSIQIWQCHIDWHVKTCVFSGCCWAWFPNLLSMTSSSESEKWDWSKDNKSRGWDRQTHLWAQLKTHAKNESSENSGVKKRVRGLILGSFWWKWWRSILSSLCPVVWQQDRSHCPLSLRHSSRSAFYLAVLKVPVEDQSGFALSNSILCVTCSRVRVTSLFAKNPAQVMSRGQVTMHLNCTSITDQTEGCHNRSNMHYCTVVS